MVIFLCILFFITVLILVYFTATGSPQAGLIEVGVSALIFISLFLLIMKFFPFISMIFTLVIIIGFGIAVTYTNYYFLRIVKEDAPFRQLLVGDLLVNKIVQTIEKGPVVVISPRKIPEAFPLEKPLPEISLDQLRGPLAAPTMVGLERLLPVPAVGLTAKGGIADIVEKYEIGRPLNGNIRTEILGLEFVLINGHKYMIREIPDKKGLKLLPIAFLTPVASEGIVSIVDDYKVGVPMSSIGTGILDLKFTHETPTQALEGLKRQPPLSEMEAPVPMIRLDKPLKEGLVSID